MRSILSIAVFSLASLSLWGQATSQIQGIVKDSTGASIGAADVKVTQTDTGIVRTVSSAADGNYVLASLPLGPYRLEVTKPGFSTYVQSGIVLQVNTNPTIDVTLNVGEVSTQVQVEANAALVDVQGTSVGAVIEQRRIVELPLNGRNPVELIQLAGAAVPAGTNHTAGMPGGLNISVGGGLLSGVTYFLDGTLYNNPFDAVNLPFPFPDALQEFKVETNSLTAQNGLHSGAAVSAVVKSGTNEIHGDAFEFLRNGAMNARNFFASRRDTLKRNQFGGTLGGAIIRNKLFFFGGYQGTILRSDPADTQAFVPTAAMLRGDFNQCATFPATLRDPLGGNFPNRQIPVSRFSAPSLEIVKRLPTSADPCGRATFGPIQRESQKQFLGRGDYQISDKQFLFGRYMGTTYLLPPSFSLSNNLLDSTGGGLDNMAQTAAIGHTYLFTPTTVNTFRAAYNRVSVFRFNDDYFSPCDIGVKVHCFVPHQTVVGVTGGFTVGVGTAIEASFVPSYWTLSDDVSKVRGNHQFMFGYAGFKYQHSQRANVFSAISSQFNGLVSGLGMADFLMGQMSSMTQGSPNTVFTTKWYHGLYAQDTWKASRKLTVNAGIRYEPFLPQRLNNGAVYNYDVNRLIAGTRSQVFRRAPAGLLYAGDQGFEGLTGVKNRYNQFAPRLGLAYDPKGDGKTVIRAAFGMSYDFPNLQIMSTPATAPPFGNTITPQGPLPFADPYSAVPGGNPFPGSFGPDATFVNFGSFMAQQPDAKATTVYSWNLSLQRQLGNNWLVQATYMGTQTAHLWVNYQLNEAQIIPGAPIVASGCAATATNCNAIANTNVRRLASRINPAEGQFLGPVDQFESGGTISYNGLLLGVAKRLTRGVSLQANYTWSHCIGDLTQASTVGGLGTGLNIANDRRFDRGNCQTATLAGGNNSLDRRHIFNFTTVLESPRFDGRALRTVASNWRLSTSYRQMSATFLTASVGLDNYLRGNGGGSQRPNQVLEDVAAVNQGQSCAALAPCVDWLNPNAFAQPALGTLGNLGRSNIRGPGFFQIDAALSRLFRVRETKTLEVRGEAFNLTNSTRFNNPTVARNNNNFGRILGANDPRILQLALKFVF